MKAVIVSIAPYQTIHEEAKFGHFYHLGPKDPEKGWSRLVVQDETQFSDYGFDNRPRVFHDGKLVAEDLVRGWKGHGVFVAAGDEPTKQELDAAKNEQRDFWLALIEEADKDWSRFRDHRKILSTAKVAARELGVKREWALDASEMKACPACKLNIPVDAIKCSNASCGAILDIDKAYEFFLISKEEYEARKARKELKKTG